MNPLLCDALAGNLRHLDRPDVAALRIMSAMRGPDSEEISLKRDFTTLIRAWVLGNSLEAYDRVGYTHKVDFTPLSGRAHALKCVAEAQRLYDRAAMSPWKEPNLHYLGHVLIAFGAIAYLEGWDDKQFRRWFAGDGE